MDIGRKIGIVVVSCVIITSSLLFYFNAVVLKTSLTAEFYERVISVGEGTSAVITKIVDAANKQGKKEKKIDVSGQVTQQLQSAALRKDMLYAVFYPVNGPSMQANAMDISNFKAPETKKSAKKVKGYYISNGMLEGWNVQEMHFSVNINRKRAGDVVLGFSIQSVEDNINKARLDSILASIAGTAAAAGLIMLYIFFAVVKPLRQLSGAAEAISRGEAATTAIKESGSKDEIGSMTRSFAVMAQYISEISAIAEDVSLGKLDENFRAKSPSDTLGNAFVKIVNYIREIARIASDMAKGNFTDDYKPKSDADILGISFMSMLVNLKSLVSNIKEQSVTVASSSKQLVDISSQLRMTATQLSETVSHISQATSQSASDSQDAATSSRTANTASQKGREQMEIMLSSMKQIQAEMETSVMEVNELSVYSEQINKMLDVIKAISEETKLLSFNAAIESARAGEHGRGFTVVAEEIRSLSDNSSQQLKKITTLVRDIRTKMSMLVVKINRESEEIKHGVELAGNSHGMFMEIAGAVDNTAMKVESIAASSEEIAASAEESAASSQEQTASVQELAAFASELENTAKILNASAEKFKL